MIRWLSWLRRCCSSSDSTANSAPQTSHGHTTTISGSPSATHEPSTQPRRCRLMCAFRLLLCENGRSHTPQTKGRSPVWIRTCRRRFDSCANDRPHRSHSNGRSPLWVRRCIFNTLLSAKPRLHTKQTKRRRLWTSESSS